MHVNTLLLLGIGLVSLVALALTVRMLVMRKQLREKIAEVLTTKKKVSELQDALDKKIAAAVEAKKKPLIKPTPLLWMNNAPAADAPENNLVRRSFSADIPSPEHETKYKGLYCKLDEHIQKFSGLANQCLATLANDLRHTELSKDIKGSLADLAVQLKRLNPLLNTDNINLTIFGELKEPLEEPPIVDSHAQGLRNVIIQQRSIILDLKDKLSKMKNVDSKEYEEQLNQLEKMLAESDTCVKMLEKELMVTHSQLEAKQTQVERADFLQTRIKELESLETKLVQEVTELKNECLKGTISAEKEQEFMNRITDLRSNIVDKEKQLGKFKSQAASVENEYLRLFENYQGLLNKYNVKDNDDLGISKLTTEQMLELEETKALLKSKQFELDRSSAECRLLETSYLDLLNSADALEKAKEEMDRLRIENSTLGNQLEQAMGKKAPNDGVFQELNDLKQKYNELKNKWDLSKNEMDRLRNKENELTRLRIEYRMMEEQFLTVATAALG